jgi:hypothetical protein
MIIAKVIAQYAMRQNVLRVSTCGSSSRIWDMINSKPQSEQRGTELNTQGYFVDYSSVTNPKAYQHGFLPRD